MEVLVTGGAGYIGSHTVVSLIEKGYDVVIVDNLSNSSAVVIDRINQITGKKPTFYQVDLCDIDELEKVIKNHSFEACLHFAGLKAVGESCEKPILYYNNNIVGTLNLISLLQKYECYKIIFSSSATVYGDPLEIPISENCPKGTITNPYGKTKSMIEEILIDLSISNPKFEITILRYFNPIGAHKSGLIGEDPRGIPNNLMPYIAQVAIGKRECLSVWGNDYNTVDGTGVRDYIHVVDLAIGHVKALEHSSEGVSIYNLGTGRGYSVLEVLHAFEKACGHEIPYKICDRRKGDIDCNYANCKKAESELGFKAKYDINDMCQSTWNFQKNNPNGYEN